MAQVNLTPASINASITQAAGQFFTSTTVTNPAGVAIDLSAYTSLTAKAVATVPNPVTADVTFGTVTASALGIITLQTSITDLATKPAGTAKLIITGKPTAGDDAQLLASGTLTVNPG